MRVGAITVTFSIIIFLSVMVFLKPDISTNANRQHTYLSAELQKAIKAGKNATPYYDLSWKDRMALEQSVWGFELKDMLLFSALFGVFFGSLKMAASRPGR